MTIAQALQRLMRFARGLLALAAALLALSTAALAQPQARPHHNSVALIIGNQRYQHTTPVIYAHNDARAIERYLVERLGFRRSNIVVKLDVGREQMETLFGEPDRADGELMDRILDRRLENRGDVFVFYSGHGVPDPDAVHDDGRRAFLLPVDVRQDRIAAAAFPIDRLHRKLDLVRGHLPPERKVVLMMDACFSGRTPVARGAPGADGPDASIFRFSRGSFTVRAEQPAAGLVRLVAATGDQVAYWDDQRKLGLFTSLFLRGVGGEADGPEFGDGDGRVSGEELARYLEERVPAEARLRHQRTQRPALDGVASYGWTLPPVGRIAAPPVPAVPVRAQPAALTAPASPAPAPPAPIRAEPPKTEPPQAAPTPVAARPAPTAAPPKGEPPKASTRAATPQKKARAAPRAIVEDDEEEPKPRPRRVRPAAAPKPPPQRRAQTAQPARPRPAAPAVRPAAATSGGCRVINGVRFCG